MFVLTSILALCLALQVICVDPTYVVYPKDGTNKGQTDTIAAQLKGFADPKSIYTSSTKSFGINFWTLPLKSDQLKKVQENKDVSLCFSFVGIVEVIYLIMLIGCIREHAV